MSFTETGRNARDPALTLSEEHGIGAWDGGVPRAPVRPAFVRPAPAGLGTGAEHIDRLLSALAGPAAR